MLRKKIRLKFIRRIQIGCLISLLGACSTPHTPPNPEVLCQQQVPVHIQSQWGTYILLKAAEGYQNGQYGLIFEGRFEPNPEATLPRSQALNLRFEISTRAGKTAWQRNQNGAYPSKAGETMLRRLRAQTWAVFMPFAELRNPSPGEKLYFQIWEWSSAPDGSQASAFTVLEGNCRACETEPALVRTQIEVLSFGIDPQTYANSPERADVFIPGMGNGLPDPYVAVLHGNKEVHRTQVRRNSLLWEGITTSPELVLYAKDTLHLELRDRDDTSQDDVWASFRVAMQLDTTSTEPILLRNAEGHFIRLKWKSY